MEKEFGKSPYEEDDFVFEGDKNGKDREAYVNGAGCPDGNKCLNSRKVRWDEQLTENIRICYACRAKGRLSHRSVHCEAQRGGYESSNIPQRV